MNMESSRKSDRGIVAILFVAVFCLSITSAVAETYRWKDKEGKTHYGSVVPAEYADRPYDVLNSNGMVIQHIEDTTIPMEAVIEKEKKERAPLISEEERQIQSDRLLVIQYRSEEDIEEALALEVAQLGYDSRLINQSYASTSTAIRDQVRQAANQQRAGQKISEDQQNAIDQLYARRGRDEKKRAAMSRRKDQIRARFQADLDRYRFLISRRQQFEEEQADQG